MDNRNSTLCLKPCSPIGHFRPSLTADFFVTSVSSQNQRVMNMCVCLCVCVRVCAACVCVCGCVCARAVHLHIHTHTHAAHTYTNIYIHEIWSTGLVQTCSVGMILLGMMLVHYLNV